MARELFHVPEGIYLLSHSVGCLPRQTQANVAEHYFKPWQMAGGDAWPDWLAGIDGFCQELASLLGGKSQEFCPQVNLSSALTKYLCALALPESRRTLLMHAEAFPSMGFVGTALAPLGFKLKLIGAEYPAEDPSVWRDHLTSDVGVALITHVHSNTGIRSPVADLTRLCREQGVKSVVDVAQSSGIVPFCLTDWSADLVLGSCVKWLCGGPGAGFMWVDCSQLDDLQPLDVGWFSHQNPFEFDIQDFRYAPDAKRFWGGTPSVMPYLTAAASIKCLRGIGVDSIFAHNRRLAGQTLDRIGEFLSRPVELDKLGGTLCLPIKPEHLTRISLALAQGNCRFDQRGETLRLSWHIYNNESEVQHLAALVRA